MFTGRDTSTQESRRCNMIKSIMKSSDLERNQKPIRQYKEALLKEGYEKYLKEGGDPGLDKDDWKEEQKSKYEISILKCLTQYIDTKDKGGKSEITYDQKKKCLIIERHATGGGEA